MYNSSIGWWKHSFMVLPIEWARWAIQVWNGYLLFPGSELCAVVWYINMMASKRARRTVPCKTSDKCHLLESATHVPAGTRAIWYSARSQIPLKYKVAFTSWNVTQAGPYRERCARCGAQSVQSRGNANTPIAQFGRQSPAKLQFHYKYLLNQHVQRKWILWCSSDAAQIARKKMFRK